MHDLSSSPSRFPLMPDAELLRLIDEMLAEPASVRKRQKDREQRARLARRVEAISREIRARGMSNPPWWSSERDWEIEDPPVQSPMRVSSRASEA